MSVPSRRLRLNLIATLIVVASVLGSVAVITSDRRAPSFANGSQIFTALKPYRSTSVDGTISVAVPKGWSVQWLGRNGVI